MEMITADNPFAGLWKLISCDAVRSNGSILPIYGKTPIGRLFYDVHGNMSVHIMKAGRPNFKSDKKFRATLQEMRAAYEGYEAYFSTYEFNKDKGIIVHHLIGGLFPNWTDSDQIRYYRFDGIRLILSTEPFDSRPIHKTIVILIWEKLT
jgi:hypothetical protein